MFWERATLKVGKSGWAAEVVIIAAPSALRVLATVLAGASVEDASAAPFDIWDALEATGTLRDDIEVL
jgi:hypothetical protein